MVLSASYQFLGSVALVVLAVLLVLAVMPPLSLLLDGDEAGSGFGALYGLLGSCLVKLT